MSKREQVVYDGDGRVVSRTVTQKKGAWGGLGCIGLMALIFVLVGPAAWAGNGQIPLAAAVVMYLIEATLLVAVIGAALKRHRVQQPPRPASSPVGSPGSAPGAVTPAKRYSVKCPHCATTMFAPAGSGVKCPECGGILSVTPYA
ncbi:MAG: hypothetical protein DLM65_00560 [Candidatus Aeolococcus gillhamiae]|uniref:Uncharacterized protein n=1 Tax=Candidatus Aeolococcus gillhamiae TaxID=3127015 RepID=A0A2W6AKD9_9BACT|nr:MAG: hypothetical protein DLM65_00560 [Candidatus Dormibacter sp. RRmetagenome_bin12]